MEARINTLGKNQKGFVNLENAIGRYVGKLEEGNVRLQALGGSEEAINQQYTAFKQSIQELTLLRDRMAQGEVVSNEVIQREIAKTLEVQKLYNKAVQDANATQGNATYAKQLASTEKFLDSQILKLKDYQRKLQATSKNAEGYNTVNNAIQNQINKLEECKNRQEILTQAQKTATRDVVNGIKSQTNELAKQGKQMQSNTSIISKMARTFTMYFSATSLMMRAMSQVREGISNIIKIEDALISLNRVSNLTKTQLEATRKELSNVAYSMGTTSKEIINATTSWKKMGESIENSKNLAQLTTKFNLAGDINNIEEATTDMIAIMRGFNFEAENMNDVVDKMNYTANNYALTASDIANILQRSSATLAMSGNTLEQSIAMGTVAQEVNQNAEKVGNGLKTLSMRLRGTAEDGDELDAKLGKIIKRLTGVDLTDANGQFRSTYDVLVDIGEVYNDLDSMTQATISEKLFGKQQANVGNAILSNAERLKEVYSGLMSGDAYGSVNAEYQKYLDSTTAKIQQLKEATYQLISGVVKSGAMKAIVSGLASIVQAMARTKAIIPLLLGAILALANTGLNALIVKLGIANAEMLVTAGTMTKLTAVIKGLFGLISKHPIGALVVGITGGLTVLGFFKSEAEKTQEAIDELGVSYQNLTTSLNNYKKETENIKSIQENIDKQTELNNKLRDTTSAKESYNIKKQLVEVEKELAESLDGSITGYTAEGEALAQSIEKNKQLLEIKKLQAEESIYTAIEDNKDSAYDAVDTYKEQYQEYENIQAKIKKREEEVARLRAKGTSNLTKDQLRYIKNAEEELNTWAGDLAKVKQAMTSAQLTIEQYNANIEEYNNTIAKTDSEKLEKIDTLGLFKDLEKATGGATSGFEELNDTVDDTAEKLETLKSEISDISDEFNKLNSTAELVKKVMDEFAEYGNLSYDTIGDILSSGDTTLIDALGNEATFLQTLGAYYDELTKKRDEAYQSGIDAVHQYNQAQNESQNVEAENVDHMASLYEWALNKKAQASAQTEQEIQNNVANTTDSNADNYNIDANNAINSENDKTDASASGATSRMKNEKSVTDSNGNNYNTDESNKVASENDKIDTANAGANSMGQATANYVTSNNENYNKDNANFASSVMEKSRLMNEFVRAVSPGTAGLFDFAFNLADFAVSSSRTGSGGSNNVQYANRVGGGTRGTTGGTVGGTDRGTNGNSSSSNKGSEKDYSVEDLEDLRDKYFAVDNALQRVNTSLETNEALKKRATGKDYRNALNEEIKLYKLQQQRLMDKKNVAMQELQEQRQLLARNGFQFNGWEIQNYQARLKQLTDQANAMKDSSEAEAEAKKKAQENVKELQKATEKYAQLCYTTIPDIDNQYSELSNTIKEVYKTMSEGIESAEQSIANVIEHYAEKNAENMKKPYEETREALQKLRDEESKDEDMADKRDKLAELKSQIDMYELDGTASGKKKLRELQKEYEDLMKEMNTTIKDNQFEAYDSMLESKIENVDKELEDYLKPENINKVIDNALRTGMINVMGTIYDLNDATAGYLSDTTTGFQTTASAIKQMNDELANAKALMGDLNTINSQLGYNRNLVGTDPQAVSTTNNQNQKLNFAPVYNIQVASADLTDADIEKLRAVMQDVSREQVNELYKTM